MGDKEVKQWLKEARDYIKAKEYKDALREVKKVLKKDKDNYMGLVFCGLCLAELDQPDQALQAYNKAVEGSPDQHVAWEGMLRFCEKYPDKKEYLSDHVNALQSLIYIQKVDLDKVADMSGKLAQLQLLKGDLNAAVIALQKWSDICQADQQRHQQSLEATVKVLSQQPDLTPSHCNIYETCLKQLISLASDNMEHRKQLIRHLYKEREMEELVTAAVSMAAVWPDSAYPLEWICKAYLEWAVGTLDFSCDVMLEPEPVYRRLLELSPKSALGVLAEGAHAWRCGNTAEAVRILSEAVAGDSGSTNFYGLYILARALLALRNYGALQEVVDKATVQLSKVKEEAVRLRLSGDLSLIKARALYRGGSKEKLKQAHDLLQGLNGSKEEEVIGLKVKLLASLGRSQEADQLLNTSSTLLENDRLIAEALLYRAESKLELARERLEKRLAQDGEDVEVLELLGQVLWDMESREDSLTCFLKAAKVEPNSWVAFLYLGHYYKQLPDLEKARKCYQRSYQLNPHDPETGKVLSDIYRATGNNQENLNLLTIITQRSSPASGSGTWAWLRLGVHYLATDQPGLAVQALQSALRGGSQNVNCWEALGDAYMARGSYSAAQKAFEKVLALSPDSVYPRLMIASIRHQLGRWREAVQDYKHILVSQPDYLPALRGLGESLLALGHQFIETFVDRNAVDSAEQAIAVLTRAARLRPSLSGTWRLLGDCCHLLSCLHEAVVKLSIPSCLLREENSLASSPGRDSELELVGKLQILQLGVRCYSRAIHGSHCDSWSLWQQLGLAFSCLARVEAGKGHEARALEAIKQSVRLAGTQQQHSTWTAMGVVAAQQQDWPLAQHAFIKSLQLENNSMAWTYLGVIYLELGYTHLANRAFKEAQAQEPGYLRGWAGQALVAEVAGYVSESMDLFRHCTFLGPESESAVGYANWVLATVAGLEAGRHVEPHNRYILEHMHGVAVAADSLTAYTSRHPDSIVAQCQLSVLLERQGLLAGALAAAERARDLLQRSSDSDKKDRLDQVHTNLGRLLAKLGRYEDSIAAYRSIASTTFHSQVGLALAHFYARQFRESYEAYESCLHWLADQDSLRSHILVAMGSLAYKVEGVGAAKTLLFQSCQLQPPSVRGLMALCVIGIQNSDMNLIEAALAEMVPHASNAKYAADISFLRATVLLLKGDLRAARRHLLLAVHRLPWIASLWQVLARFLLQNAPTEATAAAATSRRAGLMEQQSGATSPRHDQYPNKDFRTPMLGKAEGEVVACLSLLVAGNTSQARQAAVRLCHLYPHLSASWSLLASATGKSATEKKTTKRLLEFVAQTGDAALAAWAKSIS